MNNFKSNKAIINWLIIGGIMVLVMVVVGGITRLTQSGLSMVSWQPLTGILPPMNQTEWQEAFDAYKQIPQFKEINSDYTLEDFKKIFFWEYIHRILGRLIGILFIIPFIYFWLTKKIRSKKLFKRLIIIFLFGAIQGFAGWYMVKSGLTQNTNVSHFRLALHMTLAIIVLSVIFWTILELLFPIVKIKPIKQFNTLLKSIIVLLTIQIIYGGFTAGLKAGYFFPTFPKMGDSWLPEIAKQNFDENGLSSLVNFPTSVQFIHRWLGFVILSLIVFLYFKWQKKLKNTKLSYSLKILITLILVQFIFGVFVILLQVPIWLAVIHQLFAFILFLSVISVLYFSNIRHHKF